MLLVAVLAVGVNLRGGIAAVSPVLGDIRQELGLSPAVAGLLTALPVLCFAGFAPVAAWLGRRIALDAGVLVALVGITVTTAVRPVAGAVTLLAGTFALGLAMTLANVLMPAVVKQEFGGRAGTVTGLYTASLAGGAALMAAGTAPLAAVLGWRMALASWALVGLAAAGTWWAATGAWSGTRESRSRAPVDRPVGTGAVWRQPVAWALSLLLGLQSVLYYSVTAWLPTLLHETADLDPARAALAMSLFQILGVLGTFLVPMFVGRRPTQSGMGIAIGTGWMVMVAGLGLWPAAWFVWTLIGGVTQGAGIAFAFTVLVLRAADAESARVLSGMAQLIGYAVGAVGPVAVGALYAVTDRWGPSISVLLLAGAGMALAGAVSGRDRALRA